MAVAVQAPAQLPIDATLAAAAPPAAAPPAAAAAAAASTTASAPSAAGWRGVLGVYLSDLGEGHFLQRRLESARAAAATLYTKVEQRAPGVSARVESMSKRAAWISGPVAAVGTPLIERLDSSLGVAYQRVQQTSASLASSGRALVDSAWFKQVDAALRERVERPSVTFHFFYSQAVASFASLEPKSFDAFLEDMRGRLRGAWDSRLVAPARVFFAQAAAAYKAGNAEAGRLYASAHARVSLAWEHSQPAVSAGALYNAAIDHLRALPQRCEDAQRAASELVVGMRERLGTSWNESLAQPLRELALRAAKITNEELAKWRVDLGAEGGARTLLGHGWDAVVAAVDRVLPEAEGEADEHEQQPPAKRAALAPSAQTGEPEEEEEAAAEQSQKPRPDSVRALVAYVSSRLRLRAHRRWAAVQRLSGASVDAVLHLDIVRYAETLISAAQRRIEPLQHSVADAAHAAVARAQHALEAVRQAAAPRVRTLRARLQDVVGQTRELTTLTYRLLAARRLTELPHEAYALLTQSLGFAPSDAEFEEVRGHVRALVHALVALSLFWKAESAAECGKESDGEGVETLHDDTSLASDVPPLITPHATLEAPLPAAAPAAEPEQPEHDVEPAPGPDLNSPRRGRGRRHGKKRAPSDKH